MWKKTEHHIRNRILLVVILSLLAEIVLMIFFFVQYGIFTKNEAVMTYKNMAYQTVEQFVATKKEIENIAYQVSYSGSIQTYLKEDKKSEKYRMLDLVKENLNYLSAANLNVLDISVFGKDGGILTSTQNNSVLSVLERDAYKKIDSLFSSNETEGFFSEFYFDTSQQKIGFTFYYPIYFSDDKRGKMEPAGVCIVHCRTASLQNNVKCMTENEKLQCWVLDDKNMILASDETKNVGKEYTKTDHNSTELSLEEQVITQGNRKFQIVSVKEEGISVICQIPYQSFITNIPNVLTGIFFTICMFAVLVIVVVVIILQNITMPITLIVNEMKEISLSGERTRLNITCNNEIGVIASEVNQMLERIETLNEIQVKNAKELAENKLLQKQTELLFLRSQVNPHFLYNTLECIRGIALSCNAAQVAGMIASLIKLLRYTLSTHTSVLLKEELKAVMEYCSIMAIRFQKEFNYRVEVPSEFMEQKIMPMLLQPLVENSFKHGFKSGKGSLIKIRAYCEDKFLKLEVIDDGRGMHEENILLMNEKLQNDSQITEKEDADSIGLINVHKRIKMQYGEECGLHVETNELGGVTIKVKIKVENL